MGAARDRKPHTQGTHMMQGESGLHMPALSAANRLQCVVEFFSGGRSHVRSSYRKKNKQDPGKATTRSLWVMERARNVWGANSWKSSLTGCLPSTNANLSGPQRGVVTAGTQGDRAQSLLFIVFI